jgi:hypothetical protein
MSSEIITLPRDTIYTIFSNSYKKISKNIDEFFGPTDQMDKEFIKEYESLKEMIINSMDEVHKKILEENLKIKERMDVEEIIKEQIEENEEEDEDNKGFWD